MSVITITTTSRGFTLIEVMIALVIFSVGLIGLAGMQAVSVQDNTRSYARVQANFLAYDILDRMRANSDQAITYGSYTIALGANPNATLCNGTAATCSPAQLAASDLTEWKNTLALTLPAGDGSVTHTGSSLTDPFVITVSWKDDLNPASAPLSISITSGL